ncbi:LysR family transcriptional regulator [Streptomyces sp. NPDC051784]|uniref:LysR family transcriptional regulator n=1 Tax=Streptomyces sp. NPDC051784 TaxID=3155805 RepID=UPI003439F4A6
MRYDLDDLRLFLAVVEEGSITAGARRVHLSLPSASARVRALEHHAGVGLLVRGRRGVHPTPAGAALVRHIREVLAQTARLEGAVASYATSPASSLKLLVGGSAMHGMVPRALVTFLQEHPGVDVHVTESRTPDTVRALLDGEADWGVVVEDEALGHGLVTELLTDDSLVVIGHSGGVLAGRTALSYSEVAEHPLVGLTAGASLRRWIEKHAAPQAPLVRYRTTVGDLSVVCALAAAGVGLALVPRHAVDASLALAVCALEDPWARRRQLLARGPARGPVSEAAAALAVHLRGAAARQPVR